MTSPSKVHGMEIKSVPEYPLPSDAITQHNLSCPMDSASGAASRIIARDRALLYMRGMDIDPVISVELALESLKRVDKKTGGRAKVQEVMQELHSLLREQGISLSLAGNDGLVLESAPPMNRRTMISEDMNPISLSSILKMFLGLFAKKPSKSSAPEQL